MHLRLLIQECMNNYQVGTDVIIAYSHTYKRT